MGIFLAFSAMICWGMAPLFGKLGLIKAHSITALSIRTLFAATLILGWNIFFQGFKDIPAIPLKNLVFILLEALLATIIGDLTYFMALKRCHINQVNLIMSSSPLVTMLAAYAFLKERATYHQVLGALLIIGGLILVGLEPKI